ncbi:peptidoglycan recognition protein family protein [Stratiformator vulcanicus]|uniref:N-acetylmuramoyl-L-alanine amidase n=1 Tax=Stratiformator vulcanicus TaxID=2527980 RepID=A0A517QX31_9PLAN|nr:peptidoglycan recognition family protein [Stratiformator vulcanicus]QDT36130.1 N-acetylmuramoyl-L-alanine amidase [Stratiformator vulcanicus]
MNPFARTIFSFAAGIFMLWAANAIASDGPSLGLPIKSESSGEASRRHPTAFFVTPGVMQRFRTGQVRAGLGGVPSVKTADPAVSEDSESQTQDIEGVLQTPPDETKIEKRDWQYLVIHHTATVRGSVATIDAAHRRRVDSDGNPWRGIGYHFVIGNGRGEDDGEVLPTFRWKEQLAGAHAGSKKFNNLGIGIALVGNFEQELPTERQTSALRKLIAELVDEFDIPPSAVMTHGQIRATKCPGRFFDLRDVMPAKASP